MTATTTKKTTFFSDGYTFVSPFSADDLAPVSDLSGSTLQLSAAQVTGASVVGVGSVLGPLLGKGVFAPASLEVGEWDVQLRLITTGQPPKTILAFVLEVLRSV